MTDYDANIDYDATLDYDGTGGAIDSSLRQRPFIANISRFMNRCLVPFLIVLTGGFFYGS